MQLTLHADYGLRALVYLAVHRERLVPTTEISEAYDISTNHLVKVMLRLTEHGFVECKRGRTGGHRLAKPLERINLGDVVRALEPHFRLAECFEPRNGGCQVAHACGVSIMLHEALEAFLAVLDRHTLADVVRPERAERLREILARSGV